MEKSRRGWYGSLKNIPSLFPEDEEERAPGAPLVEPAELVAAARERSARPVPVVPGVHVAGLCGECKYGVAAALPRFGGREGPAVWVQCKLAAEPWRYLNPQSSCQRVPFAFATKYPRGDHAAP